MEYKAKRGGHNESTNKIDGAYDRPATTGRGSRGGRGGRGGYENKPVRHVTDEEKKRPNTSRGGKRDDEPRGGKRDYEPRGGKRDDNEPRGSRRPVLDESSWQWRFKNEKRPTYENKTVSMDEETPELPTDIKKKPSKDEYDRKMRELDEQANLLRAIVED